MNKPYRETRIAIFVGPEVGEKFKALCKKERRTYSAQLEVMLENHIQDSEALKELNEMA